MFRRPILQVARRFASNMGSATPVEDSIRLKITEALSPTTLEIYNDSHHHAHHKAMQGVASKETHFRLVITSKAFESKPQPARHRLIYKLLEDELQRDGGVHALQLKTKTPAEEERQAAKEAQDQSSEAIA